MKGKCTRVLYGSSIAVADGASSCLVKIERYGHFQRGAQAIIHQRKGMMTIPVTRKKNVVVRSVVMNSSAPPAFATVTCKASRADNPKVQASVYACVTSAAETGMRRALEKNRSYKATSAGRW